MSMSGYKLSGLALIIGTLLGVAAALFTPGSLFIDMVDQVNIRERQAAFVDNAFLTHLTSSGAIIAQALLLTGLFALWPRSDHGSAGGRAQARRGCYAYRLHCHRHGCPVPAPH